MLISVDAKTIDSSLIVNDKRSSQEEAEIMSKTSIVKDTDRTHEGAESIMNSSSIVNGTSKSQEVFRGKFFLYTHKIS